MEDKYEIAKSAHYELPVLQIFLVSQARAGVPVDQRVVVELLVLQLLGGSRHQRNLYLFREIEVRGRCVVEVRAHTVDNLTKQSFR